VLCQLDNQVSNALSIVNIFWIRTSYNNTMNCGRTTAHTTGVAGLDMKFPLDGMNRNSGLMAGPEFETLLSYLTLIPTLPLILFKLVDHFGSTAIMTALVAASADVVTFVGGQPMLLT